jgi:hypothetical protein
MMPLNSPSRGMFRTSREYNGKIRAEWIALNMDYLEPLTIAERTAAKRYLQSIVLCARDTDRKKKGRPGDRPFSQLTKSSELFFTATLFRTRSTAITRLSALSILAAALTALASASGLVALTALLALLVFVLVVLRPLLSALVLLRHSRLLWKTETRTIWCALLFLTAS